MRYQKYSVKLSESERKDLENFMSSRKATAQCKVHAKILLCLDENQANPLTVEETAKKCKFHPENVYKLRKQYINEGIERILNRKKRETSPVPLKITGDVEAHIIAVACSAVPEGQKMWTLSLIGKKIMLDGVIDSICNESVRLVLKKHNLILFPV
jgi:hypothetical protein